ncbi:MAG: deoxyguanosinetriphosphate triphosphohydrolase [bacterium]
MLIREILESQEHEILSHKAAFSDKTKGRLKEDIPCQIRPSFQQDRDRIIHSKSFRRLKHKTQVFLSPSGDHYRTRLTHTLEVSQIARTIAKSLKLNETLTEAIALAHDLGHTPFGHAGEEALSRIHPGGFHHAEQSLRVVDVLEKDGEGLNLTFEVRDGIAKHSKGLGSLFSKDKNEFSATLEADLVRISDTVAYVNHDIDDAIRAGVINIVDLPGNCLKILGSSHSERINNMVFDIIKISLKNELNSIAMSDDILQATEELRRFLYINVYDNYKTHKEFLKAYKLIEELYNYFFENPKQMFKEVKKENLKGDNQQLACDFVAGMSDRYAIECYKNIFLPKPWAI